ncbi:hypothetical protein BGZ96_012562 [Linnemannia gamsii]|uniref:Uncharacterized protein n=1 Tax=Linnemannia gamsii TaxID=64522 RepID=A0ABQ7JQ72_9FUNG|nr:hypothetical protein BGZ96_012562 [Linnemannia gamsii]
MAQLTEQGFIIERLDANLAHLDTGFRTIYGADINTDTDSPDGQLIGLIAQIKTDLEELAESIYKALDPEAASGIWLEQRVAYAGWRSARSSQAAEVGEEEETDAELRRRFFISRAKAAQNSVDGMIVKLLQLADVRQAVCLENDGDTPNADDVPAHSLNIIVEGGSDADIARVIFDNKTAGTGLRGGVQCQIRDNKNMARMIRFDRPAVVACAAYLESVSMSGNPEFLIKCRIAKNHMLGTVPDITQALDFIFGGQASVYDQFDMSFTVTIRSDQATAFKRYAIQTLDILPRPAGVNVKYVVLANINAFGFAGSPGAQGFNQGKLASVACPNGPVQETIRKALIFNMQANLTEPK